jgi:hypothetical protein
MDKLLQSAEQKLLSSENLQNEGLTSLAGALEYVKSTGPIDHLICLGSGINIIDTDEVELRNISKMNILAATILQKFGVAKQIIISGGKTQGEKYDSESKAMKKYIDQLFIRSANEPIGFILEERSKTTKQNATYATQLAQPNSSIGIVGSVYHLHPRAIDLFNNTLRANSERSINMAFSSNVIIREFGYFIQRHILEIENPELKNLRRLSLEMNLILQNFETLPLNGEGALIEQFIAALIYKLPLISDYIEKLGVSRGE